MYFGNVYGQFVYSTPGEICLKAIRDFVVVFVCRISSADFNSSAC